MQLRQQAIANFISGISQQPAVLRSATSLEVGDNLLSSPLDGGGRRPPTEFIANTGWDVPFYAHWHLIDRDDAERYWVAIWAGNVKVWDLNGVEKAVTFPNGTAYLFGTELRQFTAFTNADYTFISNRGKPVLQSASRSPVEPNELWVWVRNAAPTTKYSLTLNGVEHNVTTDNLDGESAETVTTAWIAENLANEFTSVDLPGWTVEVMGSTIRFTAPAEVVITMDSSDGGGDKDMVLIKGRVQNFSDLPAKGRDGMVVEVAANDDLKFEKYWVKFDASGGASGVWRETVAPDTGLGLDPASMPHALIRQADGTFTFEEVAWDQRECGDETISPWPSFVGHFVSYLTFYRNRMVILSSENIVMSKAGSFFDFFRDSAMQLLDTDPIDYAVGKGKVSPLFYALEQNEDLILFNSVAQYAVKGSDLLSPKTFAANLSTNFAMNPSGLPVASGNSIFFANSKGSFSAINEYFREGDTLSNDATEASDSVQALVPKNIRSLVASEPNNMLVVLTTDAPNILFTYTYYWRGQEKVQAAWNRWVFAEGTIIRAAQWLDGVLYLVVAHPTDGVSFERLALQPSAFQDQVGLYLDRRVTLSGGVYNAGPNLTTWPIPFSDSRIFKAVVTAGIGGRFRPGVVVPLTYDATHFYASGDLSGLTLQAGIVVPQVVELSQLFFRDRNGDAISPDRTQISRLFLKVQKTGYCRVEVIRPNGSVEKTIFTNRRLAGSTYELGQMPLEDGELSVPVKGKNDEVRIRIVNDSPFSAYFLNARFTGYAHNKGG
jgi:hypothetical protein